MWMGPGVLVNSKFDTAFALKSCRDIKVMHHDELKKCDAPKQPK